MRTQIRTMPGKAEPPKTGFQGVLISRVKPSPPRRGIGQDLQGRAASGRPLAMLRIGGRYSKLLHGSTARLSMIRTKFALPALALLACLPWVRSEPPPSVSAESAPRLSAEQRGFMKWRFGMFVHFNLATFAGTDWAGGYEDPDLFNPAKLNCGQWADSAKEAGMTYLVLTVKHTEGIALYPSAVTSSDTRMFRKFRNGKGDIVREFVDACRSRELKVGLYYCFPGDYSDDAHKNAPPPDMPNLHGMPPEAAADYVGFVKRQLAEILTKYGPTTSNT